ncbi:MAG: type II secretion system F family protein [Phycisphaerales bacterium JB063]
MKLAYQAVNQSGAAVRDVLEAGSIEEASESLRAKGLFVTEILPESEAGSAIKAERSKDGWSGTKTKKLRHVAMFSRQLQVLVATGTPLADAMAALQRQTRDVVFSRVIADIQLRVEEGAPLSEALTQHPAYFDQVYRNVVLAGESSGSLDTMLDRLASLSRKQAQLRTQLLGAMVYPAVLILISIAVTVVMLTLVMPRFTGLFETLDTPLPGTTVALMWLSGLIRTYWWAALILLAGAAFGGVVWSKTPAGKEKIDQAMVRTPKLSELTRSFATAKIARLMGVLVECNISLLEAIELSRYATGNTVYTKLMEQAQETVVRGELASSAFSDDTLIDPAFYEAVRNGEQSGRLGPLLLTIADFLDEDNEVRLRSVTGLIEPLILVVLGIVVGGIAISMFLPLFDLTASAGGG